MSASDQKHGLSEEELKKIIAAKKEYMDAAANGSVNTADLAREYHDLALDILLGDHVEGGTVPGPLPGCGPNPDPDSQHVKDGGKGWGGDTASPELWKVVPMKDDPKLYKVVDDDDVNIAHKFQTEQEAKDYVKYYQCKKEQGLPIPTPEPGPGPTPEPPPTPGAKGEGPYEAKSEKLNHTIKRAERHYASGAPDDETIEANIKNISHRKHQFVVDVTVPQEMEHDDNLSLKLGGTHMGTGWFDHSFSIYKGRTGMGKEEDHPSTDLFVEEGTAIGDLRGKRLKIAATYDADTNKTETHYDLGQGWIKALEGTDVGGFNPKASTFECQLRIDGFVKGKEEGKAPEPEIHAAWVSAI